MSNYYEQLKKTIKTYLLEPQFTRALLIDGDWGCGKSFFVKNHLIPFLEKTPISNDDSENKYKVITVSLFGMSSVSEISDAILKNRIIKEPDSVDAKEKKIVNDFKEAAPDMVKAFSDNPIYKILTPLASKVMMPSKNNTILIFDDFERCTIDTLELMGYINNLCENDEYRTIIIANENEIKRYDSESGQEPGQLDAQYKRTREKLIGHTIQLKANIDDIYEDILKKAVKNSLAKERLYRNKSLICDCFKNKKYNNLRTLISIFKCTETLFEAIDKDMQFPDFGILDTEEITDTVNKTWESLLNYIAISAIKRSVGDNSLLFDNPYKPVDVTNISTESNTCVDSYWKSLIIDSEEVTANFRKDVEKCLSLNAKTKEDINHKNLSLFRLKSWTTLKDKDLNTNLEQLMNELKAKKYYVQEYRDIILVLMSIADVNTGLITNDIKDFKTPDSWKKINVSEYVEQMALTVKGDKLTKEMLDSRAFEDESMTFIVEYNSIVEPLLQEIALDELTDNHRRNPFANNAEKFTEIYEENANYYISSKRFLSLYEYSEIEQIILSQDLSHIDALSEAIKKTYMNFDGYTYAGADIDILYNLYSSLEEDRINGRPKYNKSLSRTLEIALCSLEIGADKACQYQNELIESYNL